MTEKDLNKYYWLNKEIKDIEERLAKLGTGVGAIKYSDMIKGIGGKMSSIEEKIAELKDIYMERRVSALEEYIKIEKYISNVEDNEISLIMRYRCLDLMTWNEIADKLSTDDKILSEDAVRKKYFRYFKKNK